jgi:hypothetical protein
MLSTKDCILFGKMAPARGEPCAQKLLSAPPPTTSSIPWSFAEGWLAQTFGSLVSFLAVLFLCLGSYLLGDALEHPLAAQAAAVLAAAFSITRASILLYFLFKPGHGQRP